MNERIVEWNYSGEADLTIGEVQISKVAKIALISLIAVLVIACGLGIYFRKYIYDYVVNPSVIVKTSEVEIEVYPEKEFNPKDYITNEAYLVDVQSDVDTNQLGTYKVVYTSKNRVRENTSELTVSVVDKTAPKITLVNNGAVQIERTSDEALNFDPMYYVLEYKDNYDTNPTIEYSTPNWSEEEQTDVKYVVYDSSGNTTSATLTIFIVDYVDPNAAADEEKLAELQKQLEEQQRQLEEQEKTIQEQKEELEKQQQTTTTPTPTQKPSGGNSDPTKSSDPTDPPSETTPKPTTKPSQSSKEPHLTASAVTVHLGADQGEVLSAIQGGVSCYGDIGTVRCDTKDIQNIQNAMNKGQTGDYTVHWTSDGGPEGQLSCTQTVHVVE